MSISRKFRTLQSRLPGMGKLSKYSKKPKYPGQHGAKTFRKRTFYSICLIEKQKLRYNYGLTDNKLKFYVKQAKVTKGYTSQILLKILDRRLDAIIFYAGLTRSIQSARQIIAHRNVEIKRQIISSPSYICSPKDLITVFFYYVLRLLAQKFQQRRRRLYLLFKKLQSLKYSFIKESSSFLISLVFRAGFLLSRFEPTRNSLVFFRKKRTNRYRSFIKIRKPKINVARVIEFYSRKI